MDLPFFIARRYFFSSKKKTFINVISIISIVGVALGTMVLVIVLSVFNGMEDLMRSLLGTFDPEIKIEAAYGKSFEATDRFLIDIKNTSGVEVVTEVIEDNAVVKYKDNQVVVKLKGVADNFTEQDRLNRAMVYGEFALRDGNMPFTIIGRGVQYALALNPSTDLYPLQFFYPKSSKRISPDPTKMLTRKTALLSGVFAIEKEYDENYVIVPLSFAQELLDYGQRRTGLEIKVKEEADVEAVQTALIKLLGADFTIKNDEQQHSDIYKLMRIEKLFVFIIFSIILAIASFNIFFSLTMLAIDKKKDIAVLSSMGASENLIRRIFLSEGAIIALGGAAAGLFLGLTIVLIQQEFGFISMGLQTSVMIAYPVKIKLLDLIYTGLTIVLITFLASVRPAILAAKTSVIEGLGS
ncbi:MAG: FtsX-like permease family protein [Cyclobacteriaceae bacterium]